MPRRSTRSVASPFATLERAFALLSTGPRPLALDGTGIEGLPDRPIPLVELRPRLLHPSVPHATRDAALGVLIRRAQAAASLVPRSSAAASRSVRSSSVPPLTTMVRMRA